MKNKVLQIADGFLKEHRRKKCRQKIIACLAAAAMFCTAHALIIPAITFEKQDGKNENAQYAVSATEQKKKLISLPDGAKIPEGCTEEYEYADPDNRFIVKVFAPQESLPESAVLQAKLLNQNSEEYANAAEVLSKKLDYDGFVAFDICFLAEDEEIEPSRPVYVCINIDGLLPENADPNSVAVQHHAEVGGASSSDLEIRLETVAGSADDTGIVNVTENSEEDSLDVKTAFLVNSFSTITATYRVTSGEQNLTYPNNVIAVDGYVENSDTENVFGPDKNVILTLCTLKNLSLNSIYGDDKDFSEWSVLKIELRGGRWQVIQAIETADGTVARTSDINSFLLLIRKTYREEKNIYFPTAGWQGTPPDNTADGSGDKVVFDAGFLPEDFTTIKYITFSPKNNSGTSGAKADDLSTVEDEAIKFSLFNYSSKINRKDGNSATEWRDISQYFTFQDVSGAGGEIRNDLSGKSRNNEYDADGFTINHSTVERTLDAEGFPVLDLTRQANGNPRTNPPDVSRDVRSLKYLFSSGDAAVMAYSPTNTILQKSGTKYFYNSADNAVDYDASENVFRLRKYVERNEITARVTAGEEYGNKYFDFIPFTYTNGVAVGTKPGGYVYQRESKDVDYWFGMRMDVNFCQYKGGNIDGQAMVFNFSGDDDVWVFIDDVLVLDLGGTHGAVTGSINFATGEITQHLDWIGNTGKDGVTSFPTTLKECYTNADRIPNGGWNDSDNTFADFSTHKLSFFYLERGTAAANCSINFNLPTIPEGALQVTKELTAEEEAYNYAVDPLKNDKDYQFRVLKADANGNPTDNLLINQGDTYSLVDSTSGTVGETKTVGENGIFTLKSGETALFTIMMEKFSDSEPKKYVVQEILPNNQSGQYNVTYNDEPISSPIDLGDGLSGYNSSGLDADGQNLVYCKNAVKTNGLGNLQITKRLNGSPALPETYYMKVSIGATLDNLSPISEGTVYTVDGVIKSAAAGGIIQLARDETATVKLMSGIYYKVEEVKSDGTQLTGNEAFTATYANDTGQISGTATTSVTVTNTYPSGSLILTKQVINTAVEGSTDGEFTFKIQFPASADDSDTRICTATYTGGSTNHENGNLTFTKQTDSGVTYVATLKLYHNETVTLDNLPIGVTVTVTELNTDGYAVSWKNGEDAAVFGNTFSVDVTNSAAEVTCYNTTGYILPQTGGAGTTLYTIGGLLLTIGGELLLLYKYKKRNKGGDITDTKL